MLLVLFVKFIVVVSIVVFVDIKLILYICVGEFWIKNVLFGYCLNGVVFIKLLVSVVVK